MFCTFQAWLHNYLVYNTGIAAEPKNRAPFHNFYTNNTPCDIDTFFDISAIADLTFGELYILKQKMYHSCFIPWGIIWQIKIIMISLKEATWFLFEVNIPKLWWFYISDKTPLI